MASDDTEFDRPDGPQRIDKWLWFARLLKTRTLAARLVGEGRIRVNRERIDKPATTVRPGDVVTASIHGTVRVLRVVAAGVRRGPAEEARTLYEDLTPPAPPTGEPRDGADPAGLREAGSGRPTKRDRRRLDRLQGSS